MGVLCTNAHLKREMKRQNRKRVALASWANATGVQLTGNEYTHEVRETVGYGTQKYESWVHYFTFEEIQFKIVLEVGNITAYVSALKRTFKSGGMIRGPRWEEEWVRIWEPDDLLQAGVCR